MAMLPSCLRQFIVTLFLAFAGIAAASAQTADKPPDQQRAQPPTGEAGKDGTAPKKIDEFAEAARVLGGPAANPECVWLGRRVVNLLWRDDLDTAFRHLNLYDRFGCPVGHIQTTFRCVLKQGNIDPKAPESLSTRVHGCWINPSLPAQAAQAAQPGQQTAQPAQAGGTNSQ
jgi:hypothetical protein